MHLPSKRVSLEMRSETASVWFVPANQGAEIALLIKAPTTSIKAIIAGCQVALVFGRQGQYLCIAARIFDVPEHPLFISGLQRHTEEHEALQEFLSRRTVPTFLFNEMDVCVAWSNLQTSSEDAQQISDFIGPTDKLYAGPFSESESQCLDCFCYTSDKAQKSIGLREIPILEVRITFDNWVGNHLSFVGEREYHTLRIDSLDEGEMLEKAVWAALESAFTSNLHRSPQVKVGAKLRELTDVAATHKYGTFLVEAKDLSVLQAGYERLQQRRTAGVQKQVLKAIGQLIGASKVVKSGAEVLDGVGNPISLVRDKPLHCIVLLTEMMSDGDWGEVQLKLFEAMTETKDFFHVFDLAELIMLLKCSAGTAMRLDYNLMERCKQTIIRKTIHIQSRPAPTISDSQN